MITIFLIVGLVWLAVCCLELLGIVLGFALGILWIGIRAIIRISELLNRLFVKEKNL